MTTKKSEIEPANREAREIGGIRNYYGGLSIKVEAGICYWGIKDYGGFFWEEIPPRLYAALNAFQDSQEPSGGAE